MTNNGTECRRLPDWFRSKRSRTRMSPCEYSTNEASSSSFEKVCVVATTFAAAYIGYELHRSYREFGWEGTLRWIWEGDPYEPELREALDQLEAAEFDLKATHAIDDRLKGLEETLDTATSKPLDHESATFWNQLWMDHASNGTNRTPLTIERTLVDMSDRLDKIAARIDSVILASPSSSPLSSNILMQKVKQRKKILSKTVVAEMERCDALLASYQVVKEKVSQPKIQILPHELEK